MVIEDSKEGIKTFLKSLRLFYERMIWMIKKTISGISIGIFYLGLIIIGIAIWITEDIDMKLQIVGIAGSLFATFGLMFFLFINQDKV